MVEMTTEELISYYQRHLRGLEDDDTYETEAYLVLVARDDIADRWGELTSQQRERVHKLDNALVKKHERVAAVLPSRMASDPSRWWWHLHEGPQVRRRALAAAKQE